MEWESLVVSHDVVGGMDSTFSAECSALTGRWYGVYISQLLLYGAQITGYTWSFVGIMLNIIFCGLRPLLIILTYGDNSVERKQEGIEIYIVVSP